MVVSHAHRFLAFQSLAVVSPEPPKVRLLPVDRRGTTQEFVHLSWQLLGHILQFCLLWFMVEIQPLNC